MINWMSLDRIPIEKILKKILKIYWKIFDKYPKINFFIINFCLLYRDTGSLSHHLRKQSNILCLSTKIWIWPKALHSPWVSLSMRWCTMHLLLSASWPMLPVLLLLWNVKKSRSPTPSLLSMSPSLLLSTTRMQVCPSRPPNKTNSLDVSLFMQ